ncbi:hypothetical protein GW17_00028531 [Ensete ventricosum]|nr:hypothetical protein GW17_00028531 [Ensete ventricosum]
MKDVDLETISMNLKEEGRYVVNRGEDLTTIDFGDDISLAEKLVQHGIGAVEWMVTRITGPQRATIIKERNRHRRQGAGVEPSIMVARIAEPHRATTDRGEESASTTGSWSGAVDNVVEASIVNKRLPFP